LPNLIHEVNQGQNGAGCRGQVGVDEDHGDGGVSGGGGSWIEAEPSQPEDKDAQCGQGDVVSHNGSGFTVFAVFAEARSQDDGTCQSGPSAHGVNHGGAGEIDESQSFEPATPIEQAAPCPAAENRIDNGAEYGAVGQVTDEFSPLGHGA
jgi:hypothetical protein